MAGSSHGHTPAAWTGVIISFIGFCVAGVFMVAANRSASGPVSPSSSAVASSVTP